MTPALGHQLTSRCRTRFADLPSTADIGEMRERVRFVPKPDLGRRAYSAALDEGF